MDGMLMENESMQECLFVEKIKYCNGTVGVPITFLGKHNPDQFDIIGCFNNYKPETADPSFAIYGDAVSIKSTKSLFRGPVVNGESKYFRIIVRKKTKEEDSDGSK